MFPYDYGNCFNVGPIRKIRKLLFHKYEIVKVEFLIKKESINIVSLKLYSKK